MRIIGLDTETTGLKPDKGDRIIELSAVLIDTDTEDWSKSLTQRINPRRSIAPAAQAVHGISEEDLLEMPYFEDFVDKLTEFLEQGEWLICHNLRFDGDFLVTEYERIGKTLPDIEGFCTMENGRWATATGKLPSLEELCFCCGVEYDTDKAHAAEYDVQVMLDSLRVGLNNKWFNLEEGGAA